MSLYNLVFGFNPWAGVLLQALNITPDDVPRFRDCYLAEDDRIVLYTRTGGGNRSSYSRASGEATDGPLNDDLRELPGYLSDEDDPFDSTYAKFYYTIPPTFFELIKTLREISGETVEPEARWKKLMQELDAGVQNETTTRAKELARAIAEKIRSAS